MSQHNMEPLPPDIEDLLEKERSRPGPGLESRDKLLGRVALTMGLSHLISDGALAASGAAAGAASAGAKAALGGLLTSKALIPFVVGALAGVGGSTLYHKATEPEQPPAVALSETEAAAPLDKAAAEDHELEVGTIGHEDVEKRIAPSGTGQRQKAAGHEKPATSTKVRNHTLSSERTLIEMARTALSRGNGKDALAALKQHKKAHPRGKFVEEREALTILALLDLDERDRAVRKAALFKKRYPRSMFSQTIDAALKKADP